MAGSPQNMSSVSLLNRAHAREKAAPGTLTLDGVYRAHAAFVWRLLRSLGVPDRDVDDVTHDVFLVVERKLPEFEGRSKVRTWLYAIALRTASDYRRRARHHREQAGLADEINLDEEPTSGSYQYGKKESMAILRDALNDLDEEKRQTFVLFEVDGIAMQEVAKITGVPLFTAYARLRAARKYLRRTLEEAGVSA